MFQVSLQGRVLSYPFGRVTMVLGPLCGGTRSSHSISVEDGVVTQKIDAQASTPISHPQSYELAISSMKRGWVEFYGGQSFPTSITGVINTFTTRVLTLTPLDPWSLCINLFTLDLTGMLWKMSEGQHKASCSPNLVLLLSLSLRHGLHLCFLEGFLQLFM